MYGARESSGVVVSASWARRLLRLGVLGLLGRLGGLRRLRLLGRPLGRCLGLLDGGLLRRQRLADELDDGHGGVVALAGADLGDAGVAALDARAMSGAISAKRRWTTPLSLTTVITRRRAWRSPRLAKVMSRSASGRRRLALASVVVMLVVLEQRGREVRQDQPLVRRAAAEAGTLGGGRHVSLLSGYRQVRDGSVPLVLGEERPSSPTSPSPAHVVGPDDTSPMSS